jgi:hypothetical protein
MTMLVFVGPTLSAEEIAAVGDFVCLPPVTQGDLYRAARRLPRAIGIIDGYFSGAPSVWHKEILWAIAQGIPVFGSASMGALRAAELHAFGMRGVGRIFEAFRDGTLDDDDEVAVVHGPAEIGYVAACEPMVNIRSTLARAEAEGIISVDSRRVLEAFGKRLFFPQRNWEALLSNDASRGVAQSELTALKDWLPRGRVDQKRADALEMLAAMRESATDVGPPPAKFVFEWTHFWDEFVRECEAGSVDDISAAQRRVIEELALEGPEAYARIEAKALLRMVAASGVGGASRGMGRVDLQAALADIRARLGLYVRADLDRWMAQNDLDATSLERLVADETAVRDLRERSSSGLAPYIVDELRLSGAYERLAERARKKSDAIAATRAAFGMASSRPPLLRLWFFEERLGQPLPEDIGTFARRLGFANAAQFDDAVQRERQFLEAEAGDKIA